MQPFSFFLLFVVGGGGISGRVRALNLTVPLGSGRVGSDDLGYGPGSGFSFEPVQISSPLTSAFGPLFDVRRTFVQTSRFRPSSAISITLEKSSRPCVGFYHQTTVYCHAHSFTFYSLYLIFYSFYFLYTSLVMYSTIFALSMEQT